MSALRLFAWGIVGFLMVGLARSQTVTWTGSSTANSNFSTVGNWTPSAPTSGSNVVFDTSLKLTAVVDANLSINSLAFTASAPSYTLSSANNAVLTIGAGGLQNSSTSIQTLAGAVVFSGSTAAITTVGTLKVTGSIANSGAPLIVSSGTLQIGDGGTAGTLGSGVNNSGALVFNRADAVSYSAGISGTGSVTQAGAGTLTLGGTNSYSGTTSVQSGTLADAGAAAFSPSSAIAVKAGAALQVTANETIHGLNDFAGSGGTVTLQNSGTVLTVTGGGSQFSGAMGGAGGLTIGGGAFLTLSGTNSYSGGTVIIDNNPTGSGGIPQSGLQIGAGGVTGSITGAITNNGFLSFNRSDDITYSSGISGTGSLNQIGTGTLTLGGTANTYRGPTFIGSTAGSGNLTDANDNAFSPNSSVAMYGGTLKVTGNETIKGLGDLTINNVTQAGTVTVASGKTLTLAGGSAFSGSISGAGALALTSGAFETLAGSNSYTGGTNIGTGAILQIGNGGTGGSLVGSVIDNGQLNVNRTGAISLSGISGSGGMGLSGGGTLTLSTTNGANTYGGVTMINAGTLADGNAAAYAPNSGISLTGGAGSTVNISFAETIGGLGGLAGSIGSTVNLGAALTVNPSGMTYGGRITGAGSLSINSGGTQLLAGDNNYTGGTTINSGGTLQIGSSGVNGGSTGSVTGDIVNNGNLVFGRSDTTGSYAGIISGAGNVSQNGAGSVYQLTGQNTYTGSTNVNNGAVLVLGATSGVSPTTFTNANINNGTLQVRAVNALPMASSVFLSGSGGATVLDVGANQQIGRLSGQGTVNLSSGVLTIAPQGAGSPGVFSGNITGTGALVIGGVSGSGVTLTGNGSFSGGTTVNAGASLLLATGAGDPLGTGTLTLQSTAALAPSVGDFTIANPVTVSGVAVTFGATGRSGKIGLSGNVTLASSATTVNLTYDQPLLVTGPQLSVPTGATVTFQSGTGDFGLALLGAGSLSGSISALTVNNAGVTFGSANVLGGITKLQGSGYVGVAFSTFTANLKSDFLDKIDKLNFTGTIGFDGRRDATGPLTFSDPVDLSGFNAGVTLGSLSGAILTGAITPQGTNYQFGNGGGFLVIQSALGDNPTTHAARGVVVNSATNIPSNGLFAIFQGANSFTGTLSVANSGAVLDSAAALPAGGQFSLGSYGYLGYTEAFTGVRSFADLVATRLVPGAYTGTSVLGFDSHDALAALTLGSAATGATRLVLEPLNLSSLSPLYIGTATQALLSGSIVAPSGGTLSLVAIDEKAQLAVGSRLLAGNVTQLTAGSPAFGSGNVMLFGANTYAGGTTLAGGQLTLGRDSRRVNGAIVTGPIGTGALTVPANAMQPILVAGANSGSVVLDNPIALASALQLGLPFTYAPGTPVAPGPASAPRSGISGYEELMLNGAISDGAGGAGHLDIYSPVVLNGANTFSGGVTLRDFSYLQLGNDGALGTGSLVFGGQTAPYYSLSTVNGARTLANNVTFSASSPYSYVWLGGGDFTFNGSVGLGSNMITLSTEYAVRFNGAIAGSGRLQLSGEGTVYLNGANAYSGGTEALSGAVIFGSASAIPTNNFLQADSGAYIGLASNNFASGLNLQSAFLNRFNKGATTGTIGLDSASTATPNTFSDSVNLVDFASTAQLGSASTAILSGVITPQATSYNFGGGGGTLQVTSALVDAASAPRGVQVISPAQAPLTLMLTGANTYTGSTIVQNSAVVFGAAPAGGITLLTDGTSLGYAGLHLTGAVDGTSAAVTNFLGRFANPSTTTGYIGFDSANGSTLTINGLNYGLFGAGVGFATATNLTLGGALGNSSASTTYRFAGYKGGQLTVASALSAGAVEIGNTGTPATAGSPVTGGAVSTVTLNGANTYAGGTTLYAGALLFGSSSTVNAGAIVSGPLGTGAVTIAGQSFYPPPQLPFSPQLGATVGGLTLANPIVLNADLMLSGSPSFTLAGNLSGYGELIKTGTGTVTLTGNNGSFGGGVYIQQGTMVFGTANAFGTGALGFGISTSAPTATFLASTTINGLFGDNSSDVVNVANGVTLTINTADDSRYLGTFAGSGGALVFGGPYTSSPATLKLAGGSTNFAGGTTINPGVVVVAQNSAAFGPTTNSVNTVTLNGGKLAADSGVTLANPLVLNSGQLGGTGTFQPPSSLAIGSHVSLAPGAGAPGTLNFSGASLGSAPVLTLLSGGSYIWQLGDGATSGGGFDMIAVTGTVAIDPSATAANPFVFRILPVLPTDAAGNAVSLVPANFDITRSAQWTVLTASSITGFNAAAFSIDISAFSPGALGAGSFFLTTGTANTSLLLNFAPVPEPSTYVLFGLGALVLAVAVRRQRAQPRCRLSNGAFSGQKSRAARSSRK